jgi:hypothetical protein
MCNECCMVGDIIELFCWILYLVPFSLTRFSKSSITSSIHRADIVILRLENPHIFNIIFSPLFRLRFRIHIYQLLHECRYRVHFIFINVIRYRIHQTLKRARIAQWNKFFRFGSGQGWISLCHHLFQALLPSQCSAAGQQESFLGDEVAGMSIRFFHAS